MDACSLWVARPGEDAVCVVPAGSSPWTAAQQPDDTTGAVHYLKIPNPKTDGERGRRRVERSYKNPAWPKRPSTRAGAASRASATRGWRTRSSP